MPRSPPSDSLRSRPSSQPCRSCSARPDHSPRNGPTDWLGACQYELELAAGTSTLEETFSHALDAYASAPPIQPKPAGIRTWARQAGLSVPDKGRIPAEIRAAWDEAHQMD